MQIELLSVSAVFGFLGSGVGIAGITTPFDFGAVGITTVPHFPQFGFRQCP